MRIQEIFVIFRLVYIEFTFEHSHPFIATFSIALRAVLSDACHIHSTFENLILFLSVWCENHKSRLMWNVVQCAFTLYIHKYRAENSWNFIKSNSHNAHTSWFHCADCIFSSTLTFHNAKIIRFCCVVVDVMKDFVYPIKWVFCVSHRHSHELPSSRKGFLVVFHLVSLVLFGCFFLFLCKCEEYNLEPQRQWRCRQNTKMQ